MDLPSAKSPVSMIISVAQTVGGLQRSSEFGDLQVEQHHEKNRSF